MNTLCDRDVSILQALRTSSLSSEQQQHLESCESCRATAAVEGFLRTRNAATPPLRAPLPPASLVWIQAMIERRRALGGEVARRNRQFRMFGWAIVALCWAIFTVFSGGPIIAWLTGLDPSALFEGGVVAHRALPMSIVWSLAGLAMITGTVAAQDALTEA